MRYIILIVLAIFGYLYLLLNIKSITTYETFQILILILATSPFIFFDYWMTEKAPKDIKEKYENFSLILFLTIVGFFLTTKIIIRKNRLLLSVKDLKNEVDKKDITYYFIKKYDENNEPKVIECKKKFWIFYQKQSDAYTSTKELVKCVNVDDQLTSNKAVNKFNL